MTLAPRDVVLRSSIEPEACALREANVVAACDLFVRSLTYPSDLQFALVAPAWVDQVAPATG